MANSDDTLELVLGTRITGLRDLDTYSASLEKASESEQKIARRLRASAKVQKEVNDLREKAASTALSVVDRGEAGVGSSVTRGTAAGAKAWIDEAAVGPRERLRRLTGQLDRATLQGASEDRLKDLMDARSRTQKIIDRADKPEPNTLDNIKTALTTSRIGTDGLMPLVSKLMAVTPLAGPFLIVAEAAQAAAKYLSECSDAAKANARQFRDLLGETAGNAGEAAKLHVLGTVGGSDLGADSERLRQAVSSGDPVSAYWRMRLGISPVPDLPGHAADWGGRTIDAIEKLRSMKKSGQLSQPQELQALRSLGIADTDTLVDMSDDAWKATLERSTYYKSIHSPKAQQDAVDARAWENLRKERDNEFDDELGQGVNNDKRDYYDRHASGPHGMTPLLNAPRVRPGVDYNPFIFGSGAKTASPSTMNQGSVFGNWDGVIKGVVTVVEEGLAAAFGRHGGAAIRGKVSLSTPSTSPQSDINTGLWMLIAALSKNTDAIMAKGSIYGGGDRAQSAIPGKVPGNMLHNAMVQHALKLGTL